MFFSQLDLSSVTEIRFHPRRVSAAPESQVCAPPTPHEALPTLAFIISQASLILPSVLPLWISVLTDASIEPPPLDVLVVFPPSPGIHPSTSLEGPWLATLDPRLARVPPCLPASVGILPGVRMFCSPLPPWSSRRAPLALFPPGLPPHRLCWRPPGARVFRAPLPPWSFCRAPPWLSFGLSAPPPSLASPGTPRGFPIPWSLRDDKLCFLSLSTTLSLPGVP